MFGESDSESPRVPSPWDSFPADHNVIPRLVPEADEGNVEYKLQLLNPSPARFARLVTQLKWRLLEGGGQAYYELGVADSGVLVGLPRQQLEESLETLDMMASEIEASVIVVKEIEVPPELSSHAESRLENWDGRRSTTRKMKSPITSATEVDIELLNLDLSDVEETTCHSPATSSASLRGQSDLSQPNPSPNLWPFDPILSMFTMDVGEGVANWADNEPSDSGILTDCLTKFAVTLEISSVYKPRPMKKRAIHFTSPSHFEYTKKRLRNGHNPSDTACHTGDPIAQNSDEIHLQPKGVKAQHRDKRGKRQGLNLSSLPNHVPERVGDSVELRVVNHHTISSCTIDEPNISILNSLKVAVVDPLTDDASGSTLVASKEPQVAVVDSRTCDTSGTTMVVSQEPRLIVEAMVVWKLSVDEVFLDFQGFSLQ